MNYKIIQDEELLRGFIDWLPDLTEQEKFYCCLFSRSKYCKDENGVNTMPHIKSDKSQLKRFVTDKKRMFEKIKQLEVEIGWYKHNELPVPQEALALYITPNPRNLWKATFNSLVKLANAIRDDNKLMNPHQEVMSEIQKSHSKKRYKVFDIDADGNDLKLAIDFIKANTNPEAVQYIKTRGGVHCIIEPAKLEKKYVKTFFQRIITIPFVDQGIDGKGNPVEIMVPVIGCTQGGFIPHFINL